jgi:repressor LexA
VTVKKVIKKPDMLVLEATNPLTENRYFSQQEIQQLPIRIIGKVIYTKTYF